MRRPGSHGVARIPGGAKRRAPPASRSPKSTRREARARRQEGAKTALFAAAPFPAHERGSTSRVRLPAVVVQNLALGHFLQGHGEVVLGARLDERWRGFLEADALAELVVVVVDLP